MSVEILYALTDGLEDGKVKSLISKEFLSLAPILLIIECGGMRHQPTQ
jgi:hypothetical protein